MRSMLNVMGVGWPVVVEGNLTASRLLGCFAFSEPPARAAGFPPKLGRDAASLPRSLSPGPQTGSKSTQEVHELPAEAGADISQLIQGDLAEDVELQYVNALTLKKRLKELHADAHLQMQIARRLLKWAGEAPWIVYFVIRGERG